MKQYRIVLSVFAIAFAMVTSFTMDANSVLVAAYADDPNVSGTCNLGTLVESDCDTSFTTGDIQCTVFFTGGTIAGAFTFSCTQAYWRTPS